MIIKLRICNNFIYFCNRGFHLIPGDLRYKCSKNVNNRQTRIFCNLLPKYFPSTILEKDKMYLEIPQSRNVFDKRIKCVTLSHNKQSEMNVFRKSRGYGLFYQQNNILGRRCNYGNSITNTRHFSDTSASVIAIPTSPQLTGIWKTLAESASVEFAQNTLIWFHTSTGLPWWATIILATWGIRSCVTLPLALYQHYILAKLQNLKIEMNDIVKNLKAETNYAFMKFNWTENHTRRVYNHSLKKQWQKLIERENCHPMKSFILALVQIPMWITVSASIRNLCYMLPYDTESARAIYLELATGGFGWVTNLTAADPSFIIPVALGILNLSVIEVQYLMRTAEPSKTQKYVTNFFRLVAVGMVPLASFVPAGMSLYWASSSAFGIVQNLIVISPRVRRFSRIPLTEIELERPYTHFYENMKRRIGLVSGTEQQNLKKL